MSDTDIKLATIIKKINHLEKLVLVLLKDQDLDQILDLDHDQSSTQNHDHRSSDLSDDELVNWYADFLRENGVDPEHRDLYKITRNIRYFHANFDTRTNPAKYAMSFLPAQTKPKTPKEVVEEMDENGFTVTYLMSRIEELTDEVIQATIEQSTRISDMIAKSPRMRKTAMFRSACLSEALRLKLLV